MRAADRKTKLKWFGTAVIFLTLAALLGYCLSECICSSDGESTSGQPKKPGETPVEFLLLDTNRVDSYLAQLTEGTEASKNLGEKLTKSASTGVDKVVKAQAELKEESFVEREVTPTASSRLIELEEKLPELDSEKDSVEDGDLVKFEATVEAPQYVEPYLTVSHEATVSSLFPNPSRHRSRRKIVETRRRAAWKFRRQVGKDPRVVLVVKPNAKEWDQRVLIPVHMLQLSEERSMLHTKGTFTIFGKVVRKLPSTTETSQAKPQYVDLPTRHIWLHSIQHAPDGLICRASRTCSDEVETSGEKSAESWKESIKDVRQKMIDSLWSATKIGKSGGLLVIPLAIYK